jgi:hypothetical protein
MALASRGILRASQDGQTIIGMHNLANNTKTVFVFDVNSATVLGSRTSDRFRRCSRLRPMARGSWRGDGCLRLRPLLVQAQQSALNAPFLFPAANFTLQTTQGGAVFAQTAAGPALLTAYNIVPLLKPGASCEHQPTAHQLSGESAGAAGIQLPENLSGKMAITSEQFHRLRHFAIGIHRAADRRAGAIPAGGAGFERGAAGQRPMRITGARNSANIPVRNTGGGRLTVTAQLLTSTATSATVRATRGPTAATSPRSSARARVGASAPPHRTRCWCRRGGRQHHPQHRVYQNNRNTESRGRIIPVDVGPSNTGLTDMVSDGPRQRLYIANPSLNRIEVFDTRAQHFLAPVTVGQLPRASQWALTATRSTWPTAAVRASALWI